MAKSRNSVILHIGLHKTGTTSFQAVMHNHRADFLNAGIDPFQTPRGTASGRAKHGDLAFSVIRSGVLDERKGDILFDVDQESLFKRTRHAISEYIERSEHSVFLFSTEALSLLRTPEEIARIADLFEGLADTFTVVLVLREKSEWFESYRNQTIKGKIAPSNNRESAYYLEGDNWLTDFDSLIDVYRAGFDDVRVLEYDREDMVGKLARSIDVELTFDSTAYRRNRALKNPETLRNTRFLIRKIFGSEDQGLRRKIRDLKERWKA